VHLPDAPLRGDLPRGAWRGQILFLDAPSGIAGDMLVAALLDLGVPLAPIEDAVRSAVDGVELRVSRLARSSIAARKLDVEVVREQPSRTYAAIREILARARMEEAARAAAERAFRLLAEAEAEVHAIPVDEVHFHEVGAADSIADVIAAAVAADHLGATIVCSPLPMGRGTVTTAHGVLPLPAPATLLCLRGVPTYDARLAAELVTPTGAALAATLASRFEEWPSMRVARVGWGAGTRDFPDRPNLLRAVLGDSNDARASESEVVLLETNVDDQSGELVAKAMEAIFAAGALDAWLTPIAMKKGRPAVAICAMAAPGAADAVAAAFFAHTSTFGLRIRPMRRIVRARRTVEVDTRYGRVPVKIAEGDGYPPAFAPELEACAALAERHSVAVKLVYAAALAGMNDTLEPA
jgi:hypothetical protein